MASTLQRVHAVPNKNYKPSGTKSYVSLLHKYKFNPTQKGPYFFAQQPFTKGKHGDEKSIGGKTSVRPVLQKRIAANQTGHVPAEDSQNDAQYLW